MFESLFESRDRKVSNLIKLGDCLGRSLRENVELFSIDDENATVTYVTENNAIISGKFAIGAEIVLEDIDIESTETFQNNHKFDKFIGSQISDFIANIHGDSFSGADKSFSNILDSWGTRLKFDKTQEKLQEKINKFGPQNRIIEDSTFQKLSEILPNLIEFLTENKDKITKVPEVINATKLSNTVSQAFDFPHLTYDDLLESKSYHLKGGSNESIYEMICRQELIKKELLESKKYFDVSWAANEKIKSLAGNIYGEDDTIIESLVEAITEVPYLALVSKKQLVTTFTNSLSLNESVSVPKDDIRKFASKIFEMKKDVKGEIITVLNEKYGVNVQNLKETPSFRSLLNTQVVIFEALAKVSPSGSVQRETLSEIANLLKEKSGVESIDVNDVLQQIFEQSGYSGLLDASNLEDYFSFSPTPERLAELQEAVNAAKKKTKDKLAKVKNDSEGEDNDDVAPPAEEPEKKPEEEGEEEGEEEESEEEDSEEEASEEELKDQKLSKDDFIKYMKEMEDLLNDLNSGDSLEPDPQEVSDDGGKE